jgi:hypothetical protein
VTNAYNILLPAGTYDISVDHYDEAQLVTPELHMSVTGVTGWSIIRNTVGGWETHRWSFTIPPGSNCTPATITFTSVSTYYDGSSGGTAGWYGGGDTLGTISITGPR